MISITNYNTLRTKKISVFQLQVHIIVHVHTTTVKCTYINCKYFSQLTLMYHLKSWHTNSKTKYV